MATITPKNIAEAIYNATKDKSGRELEESLRGSVRVLWQKRMIGKSDDILKELQNIFERKEGVVRVKVTTAAKMEEGVRKKLEWELKEKHKARALLSEFFEERDVLGGMRVEVGDEVTDATYRNRLRQLEKFLMQEK
ncbi:F0F1 ATP synthase subunit delta [Candidatus Nomurabacteria bacterium]|nr:F0F1 ATP synthase subunit delta [Candidatus Nomurabacteria bacterium]